MLAHFCMFLFCVFALFPHRFDEDFELPAAAAPSAEVVTPAAAKPADGEEEDGEEGAGKLVVLILIFEPT